MNMTKRSPQSIPPCERPAARSAKRRLSLMVFLIGIVGMGFILPSASQPSALTDEVSFDEAALSPEATLQSGGGDFSKFTHRNGAHMRLPCLLCHRREANLTQPKRSGHIPCAGCHAEQFANPGSSICAICHTNPGSDKPDVKPFPKLASFNMKFDHAKHRGTSCANCHRPSGRNSVAFSIPSGVAAHSVCYQCHTARAQSAGRDISSCGTCHELGSYTRMSGFAKAFQVNFSHAKHGKNRDLDCNDCHQVKAGSAQRQQVSAPLPANHSAPEHAFSCKSCHNGKRAFGGDDFKSCQRCHTGPTFRFK
jgi:c(7)-type cytochrome triheme protein